MKKLLFPLLVLSMGLAFTAVSCTSEDAPDPNTKQDEPKTEKTIYPEPEIVDTPAEPIQLTEVQKQAMEGMNDYALKLAIALQGNNTDENFLFSPLSAQMCMALLSNGAEGDILSEMVAALGAGRISSLEDLNSLNSLLGEALVNVDAGSRIGIANSIWVNNGHNVTEEFRQAIGMYYKGDFYQTNLFSSEGKDKINGWVEDKTFGLLPNFLEKAPNGEIALVNTVALKAMWTYGFDPKNTYTSSFTLPQGKTTDVEMMRSSHFILPVMNDELMQAAEIKFGNEAYSMIVMLPASKDGVSLNNLFSNRSFSSILGSLKNQPVNFEMPKFEFKSNINLNKGLASTGMPKVFTKGAKFPKLNLDETLLEVIQKAVISVDEKGASAAAGTIAVAFGSPGYKVESIAMKCDHPFAFVIKENSTGAILFIGVVNKL